MRRVHLVGGVISTFLQSSQFTTRASVNLEGTYLKIHRSFLNRFGKHRFARFALATRRWHLFPTARKPINKKGENYYLSLTEDCSTTVVPLSRKPFNLSRKERKLNSFLLSRTSLIGTLTFSVGAPSRWPKSSCRQWETIRMWLSKVQNNRSPVGREGRRKGQANVREGFRPAPGLLARSIIIKVRARLLGRPGRPSIAIIMAFPPNYHPKYKCKSPSGVPGRIRAYVYQYKYIHIHICVYIDMSQLSLVSLGLLISSVRGWAWRRAVSHGRGGPCGRSTWGVDAESTPRKNVANKVRQAGAAGALIAAIPRPFADRIAPFTSRESLVTH